MQRGELLTLPSGNTSILMCAIWLTLIETIPPQNRWLTRVMIAHEAIACHWMRKTGTHRIAMAQSGCKACFIMTSMFCPSVVFSQLEPWLVLCSRKFPNLLLLIYSAFWLIQKQFLLLVQSRGPKVRTDSDGSFNWWAGEATMYKFWRQLEVVRKRRDNIEGCLTMLGLLISGAEIIVCEWMSFGVSLFVLSCDFFCTSIFYNERFGDNINGLEAKINHSVTVHDLIAIWVAKDCVIRSACMFHDLVIHCFNTCTKRLTSIIARP